ncbi:MAG: carboxypeptidase regulatory-like domain-containing protein [Planctomycetota bacterium]
MQRLVLLGLAAVAVVVLALVLFDPPSDAPRDGRTSRAGDVVVPGMATGVQARSPELASVEEKSAGARSASAASPNVGDAAVRRVQVRGLVLVAEGGAIGEPASVVARYRPANARGWTRRAERAPVAQDGSFSLALPEGASRVKLDLDAVTLGLDEPVNLSIDPPPESVTLSAVRGGCLRVVFTGSAADAEDALPGDGFKLVAKGVADGIGVDREAGLAGDGTVRFGGLPSDSAWRVHLTSKRFVDQIVPAKLVLPGEIEAVEIPLERGVTVRGRIIDVEGAPVPDAEITLRSWKHLDKATLTGRNVTSRSGANGRFDISGLVPGEVTLRVFADGFRMAKEELGEQSADDVVDGLEIQLDAGRRVDGRVVWPDGRPAADADVRVATAGRSWTNAEETRADAEGRFAVTGLGSGPWRVGAWLDHSETREPWRAVLDPVTGGGITLTLREGARLTGVVVDDRGTPIERASITATPAGAESGGDPIKERSRDPEGRFELEGLGEGTWDLTAYAIGHGEGRPVRVEVPLDLDGARLVLPRLARLAGSVVDAAGAPVAEVRVRASGRSTTTDDQGLFTLTKLQPGEVRFEISSRGEHGPPLGPALQLAPGEVREGVVVALSSGARVLGEVHPSARTGTELTVVLRPHDSYNATRAVVDADGRFSFAGVAPGRYRVAFEWAGFSDWIEGFRARRAVMVELEAGETEHVVLGDPAHHPITVSGEVREAGAPLAGMLMYVFSEDEADNQPLMVARTDDEGRYSVDLPWPGAMLFTVGPGQQRQARFHRTLTDEPRQVLDFDLPTSRLTGRLLRAEGGPANARLVLLSHADARAGTIQLGQIQLTMSRSDGTFEFEGLHPGEYRLRSGNYVTAHSTDGLVVQEGIVIPAEGAAPDVELVLPEGAMLDVHAVDGGGIPLSQRRIEVLDEGGWPTVIYDQRRTDYGGMLRFTGVGSGRATAVVLDDDGNELGRAAVDVAPGGRHEVTVVCRTG